MIGKMRIEVNDVFVNIVSGWVMLAILERQRDKTLQTPPLLQGSRGKDNQEPLVMNLPLNVSNIPRS